MIGLRSYSVYSSGSVLQLSAVMPQPSAVAVGDLLLWSVILTETIAGTDTWVKNTHEPSTYTDLLLDGVAKPKLHYEMLSGIGGTPDYWWWLGWKWAVASDVSSPTYTVEFDGDLFSGIVTGAGRSDILLCAFTGFDASTPFGNTAYQNTIPGGFPIPLPVVTTNEGFPVTGKTVTGSGGVGKHSAWCAIANGADGSEQMICVSAAPNNAADQVAGAGIAEVVHYHPSGADDTFVGRGVVPRPLTVHIKHPNYIGHDHF